VIVEQSKEEVVAKPEFKADYFDKQSKDEKAKENPE